MARPVNRKCQHCATLPVEEAIALHGVDGDNCWNPADSRELGYDCHRRRNHYRHRHDDNQTRRRMRKLQKQAAVQPSHQLQGSQTEPLEAGPLELRLPSTPFPYAAVLVLYRQAKDAPVHAVTAEIWQGDRKVKQLNVVHCMGMRGNEVTTYIREILEQLHQQFDVSRFEDVIKEMPVEKCPIAECPLSHQVSH